MYHLMPLFLLDISHLVCRGLVLCKVDKPVPSSNSVNSVCSPSVNSASGTQLKAPHFFPQMFGISLKSNCGLPTKGQILELNRSKVLNIFITSSSHSRMTVTLPMSYEGHQLPIWCQRMNHSLHNTVVSSLFLYNGFLNLDHTLRLMLEPTCTQSLVPPHLHHS